MISNDATMTSNDAGKPPVSHARRRDDGSWYVDVLWHNGRREKIGHFKTASEAEEFIKTQLQAWHEAPKKPNPNGTRGWGR
jgi:hypothetical protein